ncbi:MAG TPA: S41 family peptidase [Hyphomonadaceae bacterium]|nr:S41 family peptidase [Hyphomonadaceae bacterium]
MASAACAADAQKATERELQSLEDIAHILAVIEKRCPANREFLMRGVADRINRMPGLSASKRIEINTDVYKFLDSIAAAIYDLTRHQPGERAEIVERASAEAISGIFDAVDPQALYHASSYFIAAPRRVLNSESLGITLQRVLPLPVVVQLSPSYEADPSGLRLGDQIASIDGQPTENLSQADLMRLMENGATGVAMLTARRSGVSGDMTILVRRKAKDMPGIQLRDGLAIITIPAMTVTTPDAVRSAVKELRGRVQPKGYVIDVRSNDGGRLEGFTGLADLFLSQGAMGSMASVNACPPEAPVVYKTTPDDITDGAPIVILSDSQTAAGGEMFVAALVENGRARSVGQATFGDGAIRTVIPNTQDKTPFVTLTTGRYLTPLGGSLDGGFKPSVTVSAYDGRNDHPLERALELLKQPS